MEKYIKLKRTHSFVCDTSMFSNIEGDKTILIEFEKTGSVYHIFCNINGILIQTCGHNISIEDIINGKTYTEEDLLKGLY